MTDRIHSFVVVLDRDTREDDAQATLNAIQQIKGVIKVEPQIRDISDIVAEARVRRQLHQRLLDVVLLP